MSADIRSELQKIYESNHGRLTPRLVVQAAKPKSHPLHSSFEWDDKIAGEKWREEQAAELIRSVKIQYDKDADGSVNHVRRYVSVKDEKGYAYRDVDDVVKDDILTEITLREMEREWKQLKSRYGKFQEFVAMIRKDLRVIA